MAAGDTAAVVRLLVFIEVERGRLEDRTGNILGAYTRQLRDLLRYLHVTADEYRLANLAWYDAFDRMQAENEAESKRQDSNDIEETDAMRALTEEAGEAGLIVYLRIETFYVFAKILLDKLARLLPHYFGPARGVRLRAHSSLVDGALPRFAAQHGLAAPPPALLALIEDLGTRVSDYRDHFITHADSPRIMRGISFSLDRSEAAIITTKLYPIGPAPSTSSETPLTLQPVIESYVIDLIDYLAANNDRANRLKTE